MLSPKTMNKIFCIVVQTVFTYGFVSRKILKKNIWNCLVWQ